MFLYFFLLSFTSFAQDYSIDSIFVTSKQSIPQKSETSSTFTITKDDIERNPKANLLELLSQVPGIDISTTGIQGGESSIFIRGAEARHTLILIDGVRSFDPTSIGRTFNASILDLVNIERIEILKGNQSVLYGSDAIGGVINIITKLGSQNKLIKLSTGNFNQVSAGFGTDYNKFSYSLIAQKKNSEFDDTIKGEEKDKKQSIMGQLGFLYEFNRILSQTSIVLNHSSFDTDKFDYTVNKPIDDNNASNKIEHGQLSQKVDYRLNQNSHIEADLHLMRIERDIKYDNGTSYETSEYSGFNYGIDLKLHHDNETSKTIYGFYSQTESYKDNDIKSKYLNQNDFYFNKHIRLNDKHHFDFGARATNNEYFGTHVVYGVGYKMIMNSYFLRVGHHTGFKAPTIYQLRAKENAYGAIGNEDLSPEKSRDYEISFGEESSLYKAELTAFYNEVDEFIDFNQGYQNLYKVIYKGVEFNGMRKISNLNVGASFTLLDLKTTASKKLARRPRQSYSTFLDWNLKKQNTFGLYYKLQGERIDYQGSTEIKLDKYQIVDLKYQWKKKNIKIGLIVGNFLNQSYEIVKGYSTLDRNYQLSIDYSY